MRADFYCVIAALGLMACSEIDKPVEKIVPVALTYSTVQAEETRAAQNLNDVTFASGEGVMVRIRENGTSDWEAYDFVTGEAGAMIAGEPAPYYPVGSTNIDIAAVYPAVAGTSFSVLSDQTADASYKASDLMFASVTNQAKQADPVNLVFSHKMAKINVNITAGSGVSSIESLSILNVKPTVSFDLATGDTGEASGSAISVSMSNNGAAAIPAQTISGGLLSIVTDKGEAVYSVAEKAFEAGKQYTLNITVNLRAVGASTAITGWTSEGTVTVNPVSDPLTVMNVTSEHLGWIITGDGFVYENKAAVDAAGKTGVALIFYVGEPGTADNSNSTYRGLAMALSAERQHWGYEDSGALCLKTQYSTYAEAITDMDGIQSTMTLLSHTHSYPHNHDAFIEAVEHEPKAPVGTSGWFVGSMGQWNKYISGMCGVSVTDEGTYAQSSGSEDVVSLGKPFVVAGYPDYFYTGDYYQNNVYWTSTEDVNENTYPRAWTVDLGYYYPTVFLVQHSKGDGLYIRPFVAF